MRANFLRQPDRLGPPLGLHHAGVVAARAGVLVGSRIRAVFPGQNAARQRAVCYDAEPIEVAGGEVLAFGLAFHSVVVGLTDDRSTHAEPVADVADFGDPPRTIVRYSEIAHLAFPDQFAHRAHRLVERRRMVFLVKIIDVDVIGAEPLQAFLRRLKYPARDSPPRLGSSPMGLASLVASTQL